jgi:hypothetical protein
MASADIEINLAVRRDGTVASAEIGATRNLVGSAQGIESAFQAAAVAAARQATFICRRCRQSTLPYSLVYAFRFDGVVAPLDAGYAVSNLTISPSQARVSVAADVPILDAALSVRPSTLPPGCSLAPRQPAPESFPIPGNRWTGDDKDLISLIRGRIIPTGPSRYELQLTEGVKQAYVARYLDTNRETTVVYGLLFADSNDASAFVELAVGARTFLVHRTVVVAVHGGNTCGEALAGLLREPAKQ